MMRRRAIYAIPGPDCSLRPRHEPGRQDQPVRSLSSANRDHAADSRGIAENSLLINEYLDFFSTVLKDHLKPMDLAYGDQASGSKRLHRAIADLWNEYVTWGEAGDWGWRLGF